MPRGPSRGPGRCSKDRFCLELMAKAKLFLFLLSNCSLRCVVTGVSDESVDPEVSRHQDAPERSVLIAPLRL